MEKLNNVQLVKLYQNDSNELAFEELYKRNRGLIINVINKFKDAKLINNDDVVSDCNLAFSRATKTFDTSKNCKFSTYCYLVMVKEILKSISTASREKRNPSKYKFSSLNEKVNDEGGRLVDILNASESDVLHKKDYTYLHNAIEYAKSWIIEKYHPYLIPLLFRETTTNEVAPLIAVSPRTVHYTITMFRKHVREYIYHYSSGEIVS